MTTAERKCSTRTAARVQTKPRFDLEYPAEPPIRQQDQEEAADFILRHVLEKDAEFFEG